MHVVVADRLTGGDAVVLEDIQSRRTKCVPYRPRDPLCVTHDGCEFVWGEIEDRWRVPLQDHQNVTRAQWPRSDERQRVGQIINDRPVVPTGESLAEWTRVMCRRLDPHGSRRYITSPRIDSLHEISAEFERSRDGSAWACLPRRFAAPGGGFLARALPRRPGAPRYVRAAAQLTPHEHPPDLSRGHCL